MQPLEKNSEKLEMSSNVAIGQRLTKIKIAQQFAHWKKIQKK